MPTNEHGTCPSASKDAPDSMIIGYIGRDGRVAAIPTPIPLTHSLRATLGDQPERVFRLAAPCIGADCAQWDGTRCGLIGTLQTALPDEAAGPIVRCGIRAGCVWFRDTGLDACRICPSVTFNPT